MISDKVRYRPYFGEAIPRRAYIDNNHGVPAPQLQVLVPALPFAGTWREYPLPEIPEAEAEAEGGDWVAA